jgi:hypothetical protein
VVCSERLPIGLGMQALAIVAILTLAACTGHERPSADYDADKAPGNAGSQSGGAGNASGGNAGNGAGAAGNTSGGKAGSSAGAAGNTSGGNAGSSGGLAGNGAPTSPGVASLAPHASTLVVLPDTQFYACAYPNIFEQQAQWVLDHRQDQAIQLVLHTGDIVDMNLDAQWQIAADSMHRLDGIVPYLLTMGNHDLTATRDSLVASYFTLSNFVTDAWEPVAFDPERVDNTFGVVELGGKEWLVLGLEFGPRDAVVAWAGDVLAAHADLPAILFTHAYLYSDGQRYDRSIQPLQPYHPDGYAFTPEQGINDGEDLWQKLVEPHENVRLVLSGHVIPDGTARTTSRRASGTRVHQVLANYQLCAACPCSEVEGGDGYLRLLRFDDGGKHIAVSTYSPHLDLSLVDDENQFTLDLD